MIDTMRGMLRRLRAWLRPGIADAELDAELAFHVEMEKDRYIAEGMAPAAAARAARLTFGGADRFTEEAREARGRTRVDEMMQDLRLALRLMRRNPQFTAAVVLTLALGIGANTAIYSVVDAVLLRSMPFADADRLMMIWETDRASATQHEPASWPDIEDMRARSRTLEAIGAVVALQGTLASAGDPERVSMLGVTPDLPGLLGVQPIAGRTFRSDDPPGAVLLSEAYWREHLGARAEVIGRTLVINGAGAQVVGILPRHADLGIEQMHARADYSAPLAGDIDMWMSVQPSAAEYPRQTHPFLTLGRLRDGATAAAAQSELAAIMADLEGMYPENAARGVNVEAYEDVTFGSVRTALLVLLAGVGLVLLIACVNVANLLLARTAARTREVAVRRAMGASTSRIRRQFLMESAVHSVLGTAAGVLLANGALHVLISQAPSDIPRLADATLDMRVLLVAVFVSGAVCTFFGLAPLLEARRVDVSATLKAQSGRTTASRESRRFRNGLVIAQVALAVLLVIAAGLLVRSLRSLVAVDPGFRTAGVLQAEYQLEPRTRYPMDFSRWPDLPEINGFHAQLVERARALPGVESAAVAAQGPLDAGITNSFAITGREVESEEFPEIRTRFITPGYLETLGVPLIAGRDIGTGDVAGAEPVLLINRAAVARYFPDDDPLDQQLSFWGVRWRIAGVIGDEHFTGVDSDPEPAVYAPLAQAPQTSVVLLARTAGDPAALVADVRAVLRELDSRLALANAQSLEVTLQQSIARPRFIATLFGVFALLATALAFIGVHGVLSYGVSQRTSEVGIRLALGSTRAGVLGLVLREGVMLAGAGTLIGLVAAALSVRALASLLYGVGTYDLLTFAAAPIAMIVLALLAGVLPAQRAARAQPMQALRSD